MNRQRLITVLLTVACSGLGVSASAQTFDLLAFGDSLTLGFGDTNIFCDSPNGVGGYPPRLERRLATAGFRANISASGVCGERTEEGLVRLGNTYSGQQDIVFLMEGANDVAGGVSLETMLFNLGQMANVVLGRGGEPIHSAILPIRPGSAPFGLAELLNSELANQAVGRSLVYADPYTPLDALPGLYTNFYFDSFHPNADGYDVVAEALVGPVGFAAQRLGFLPLGHPHYCRDYGPCGHGEGDCDPGDQCAPGTVCIGDAGADYGYAPAIDVCIGENVLNCTLDVGDPEYCSVCGPCRDMQGDCDSDDECLFGTTCVNNVGDMAGLPANTDLCLAEAPLPAQPRPCDLPNGHPHYCRDCGPCIADFGDCDGDADCAEGLTCINNIGAEFGFAPVIDMCREIEDGTCPWPEGHPHFCRDCGPCTDGQGDCDGGTNQCAEGLICAGDVGADFGFGANIDVCVTP